MNAHPDDDEDDLDDEVDDDDVDENLSEQDLTLFRTTWDGCFDQSKYLHDLRASMPFCACWHYDDCKHPQSALGRLGHADKVFIALLAHANIDGHAWPGQTTLARACGYSQRTIKTHVKYLLENSALLRARWPLPHGGYRNVYIIQPARLIGKRRRRFRALFAEPAPDSGKPRRFLISTDG